MNAKRCLCVLCALVILSLCVLKVGEEQPAYATSPSTLLLDGSNYLEAPDDPSLNPSMGLTVEAWIRLPAENTGYMTIISKGYVTSYWLGLANRYPRFYAAGGGTMLDATAKVPIGQWTHVAGTYDGSTSKIYINGRLSGSSSLSVSMPGNTSPVRIGDDPGPFPYRFVGAIADVRLWGVARTQTQIRQDMVRLPASSVSGLLAAWNLEGNGREMLNRTNMSAVNTPLWTGGAAPPFLYSPILIPRLASPPDPIYQCDTAAYSGALRVPIWYQEGHILPNPVWVYVGATATDLYVCMANVDLTASFASFYLDVDNSGGSVAQAHDYSLVAYPDGSHVANRGNGLGGYSNFTLPGWSGIFNLTYTENYAWVGFSIKRAAITSSDGRFRMAFIHHWIGGISGNDYGWPVDVSWNSPATWPVFLINDGSVPPADSQNPIVQANHSPSPLVRAGQSVTIRADATDDTDVAQVDIFVDGSVVRSCTFPGAADTSVNCQYSFTPAVGQHSYYAHVIDQNGRSGYSPMNSFFAQIDGRAPTISLYHNPRSPLYRQSFTITAVARDASGIAHLHIISDMAPFSYTCPVSGNTTETCVASFSPGTQQIVHYWAWAEDNEHQTVETNRIPVLLGNSPSTSDPDSDNDGIINSLEYLLGTDAGNPDTDGDALMDGWEVLGVLFPDYTLVNLPELGANPLRKDIFVQYDYERGAHVGPEAWPYAINLFREHGVNLWVTAEIERPRTGITSTLNAEQAAFQVDGSGHYYFDPKLNYTHHYVYSRHYLGVSHAWHYVTIDINTGGDCPMSSSDPQNDPNCRPHGGYGYRVARNYFDPVYRVVHELGHNLGLGHGGRVGDNGQTRHGDAILYNSSGGGWDNVNQKPNYLSIMNYRYNRGGRICMDALGNVVADFDYDRAYLPHMNELGINEFNPEFGNVLAGFYCPANYHAVMTYNCVLPDGTHQERATDGNHVVSLLNQHSIWTNYGLANLVSGGTDWNCNNTLESDVQTNVNGNGHDDPFGNGPNDEDLYATNDWAGIPYNSGSACFILNDPSTSSVFPAAYRQAIGNSSCLTNSASRSALAPADDPPPTPPEQHYENAVEIPSLPNLEICDGLDNDGDQQIDEGCPDSDYDGIVDRLDNCPHTWNPDQADLDGNRLGDACQFPQVSSLEVTSDSLAYSLDWNSEGYDLLGFNVYRRCSADSTMGLVQTTPGDFPTTTYTDFKDEKDGHQNCSYCVAAINLLGQETSRVCLYVNQLYLPSISKH